MSEWIMIVGGGILQASAVNAAHDLGYKVIVSDRDLNCACAGLADHFVELSTFDVEGHIDFVRRWPHGLAAVFTAGADPIVTVAKTARAAHRHSTPVGVAETCADKLKTRQALASMDVPQPRFSELRVSENYWACARELEWSADVPDDVPQFILKATGSSGSRGHARISLQDFQSKPKMAEVIEKARRYSHGSYLLIEELLHGVELSVETLWYNGRMIPLNAVERPFIPDSNIELGHYNPAVLAPQVYERVWEVMERAGNAIGLGEWADGHILKGDLIIEGALSPLIWLNEGCSDSDLELAKELVRHIDEKGRERIETPWLGKSPRAMKAGQEMNLELITDIKIKVLELTTRLSGGFDSGWTSPLAHGVDYTKGALLLALGRPLAEAMPHFAKRWARHAACIAVFGPQQGGTIQRISGLGAARQLADEVILRFREGDVLPPLEDCAARVAFCIAARDDPQSARLAANVAASRIEVEIE